jgi:hypothetical protein
LPVSFSRSALCGRVPPEANRKDLLTQFKRIAQPDKCISSPRLILARMERSEFAAKNVQRLSHGVNFCFEFSDPLQQIGLIVADMGDLLSQLPDDSPHFHYGGGQLVGHRRRGFYHLGRVPSPCRRIGLPDATNG